MEESLLETVDAKEETGLRFSRGGCSDLEGEETEDTKRRAGGDSRGGRSSESKEGEATRVGCDGVCLSDKLSKLRKGMYHIRLLYAWGECRHGGTGYERTDLVWTSLPLVRISFFRVGMTKVSVFPEPVIASTTTALCCMNDGIVAAWRLLKKA